VKTLIIEDDAGTRALVRRIVQQSSKVVLEATNGLDALSVIEREDPDLIITDLRMPLLDGFELVAALRGSAAHAAIPVICLTSVDSRDEIARLLDAGITDYVLKPVKPAELTDRVKRALATHANWRGERNTRRNRDGGASTILIIDPDATFRSLARAQLEADYEIVEAGDAAEGLRRFNERSVKPQTVFIAEDLPHLSESRAADLLCQIAAAAGALAPRVFVIVDRDDDGAAPRPATISGTIRRSFVPTQFAANVRARIGTGRSATDRLRDQVVRDSNAWLVSAARHAFGVVTGKEIETLTGDVLDGVGTDATSRVWLGLPDAAHGVSVSLSSSADHATTLAAASAEQSPGCDGRQILGKLVAMIAWEVGIGLKARGFASANPTPDIAADVDPKNADVAIGVQTPGRETLVLTVSVVERVTQAPAAETTPEPAAQPEASLSATDSSPVREAAAA
jgi:DNA-binding response OmpR family regulator